MIVDLYQVINLDINKLKYARCSTRNSYITEIESILFFHREGSLNCCHCLILLNFSYHIYVLRYSADLKSKETHQRFISSHRIFIHVTYILVYT